MISRSSCSTSPRAIACTPFRYSPLHIFCVLLPCRALVLVCVSAKGSLLDPTPPFQYTTNPLRVLNQILIPIPPSDRVDVDQQLASISVSHFAVRETPRRADGRCGHFRRQISLSVRSPLALCSDYSLRNFFYSDNHMYDDYLRLATYSRF